jgi:hypothetical protein
MQTDSRTKAPTRARALTTDDVARVCHEANRALQLLAGEVVSPKWDLAPDWQRSSALEGVEAARAGETPEQLHESWCDYKRAEGWTYGLVKDEETRTHPCLVPYDELPPAQQRKDRVFGAIVTALTSEEA